MMRRAAVLSLFSMLALTAMAETSLVLTPGSLKEQVSTLPSSESKIVLTGEASISDLITLQDLPDNIKDVDMRAVNIVESRLSDNFHYGRTVFYANEIPAYALAGVKLQNITLPATVETIGEGAFSGSDLTEIVIPESVISIEDYAFSGMTSLKTVSGGASLTSIGKGTFSNCTALSSVNLSQAKIATLPEMTFAGDSELAELELPASISHIGSKAFTGTALQTLNLASVSEFDDYALSGLNRLVSAKLNYKAKYGEGVLMSDKSLVEISGAPVEIPAFTYADCPVLDPQSPLVVATSVGESAFASNNTEHLVIGPKVTSIDKYAFYPFSKLKDVDVSKLESNIPVTNPETFGDMDCSVIPLFVKEGTADLWRANPVWGKFDVKEGQSVSISEVVSENSISIILSDTSIKVTSSSPLSDVSVYGTTGILLTRRNSDETSIEIPVDELAGSDVIIVTAKSKDTRRTVKYVLR
ncbi:MAG: leucine-rich repeat domain-containing protein [Prevotella sp.]|nr:leucine-rich repeat domain-containing protein [Bacteroides sp.]MCM1436949.1 leucine-rich repeat domain-containing protein [Prevotella sp.]